MHHELLPPDVLARLERLQLNSRRRLAGRYTGEHRSRRYGSSLDFADYREYHPGDDFRRIDYHLLARLDVVLLKLFEAEDDIEVRLMIDTSASMAGTKLDVVRRLAAAIGFVALIRRDPVRVVTFPFAGPAPRFLGRGATLPLFDHLSSLQADGPTDFAAAASDLLGRRTLPGLTVVLSDLLTPEWDMAISRLPARGDDLAVVHVVDPAEIDLKLTGDVDLVDRETGASVPVSLSPESLRDHRRRADAWLDHVATRCRRVGAAYVRVQPDTDIERVLLELSA